MKADTPSLLSNDPSPPDDRHPPNIPFEQPNRTNPYSKNGGNGNKERKVGLLSADAYEQAKAVAPGWDVYALEGRWREWAAKKKKIVKDPDKAFIGFCKRHAENNQL